MRRYLPRDTDELIHWYTRYLSPLGLIAGFLADTFFFLSRVDQLSGLLIIGVHLVLAALAIVFLNMAHEGRITHPLLVRAIPFAPVAMQFSFGGLFSAFFSLYSRSAAFPATWLFVALLAVLLVGNERFLRAYERLTFQIGIYAVALLSCAAFLVPVVVRRIGDDIFSLSVLLSVMLLVSLGGAIAHLAPVRFSIYRTRIIGVVAAVTTVFVGFYFLNLIPPLPLALKSAGIYHEVERTDSGAYRALGEPVLWTDRMLGRATTLHLVPGESAYVFTSIFAPSGLATGIAHEWQYRDERGSWVSAAYVPFDIVGGRDAGYRGYSAKYDPAPGEWRVNVLTDSGRIIARVAFRVVAAAEAPVLAEVRF